MKILFIFGGTPHYYNKILNLIHIQKGIEVTVIVPLKEGATVGKGVFESKEEIAFNLIQLQEYKTWYGKRFYKNLYAAIEKLQPNFVITGWPYYINFILNKRKVYKLKKAGVKFISKEIPFSTPYYKESQTTFRNKAAHYQKTEKIYTSIIHFTIVKKIRKILYSKILDGSVVYIEEGANILSSYGLDREKIYVTYNSILTQDIFDTLDKLKHQGISIESQRENCHILHVGRLVKWKRVDLLIQSVAKLTSTFPNIKLTIVGNGPEMISLKNLTKKLNISKYVTFTGAVYNEQDLAKLFLKAQIYVLAGMGGLSINEAMCYQLPIVCSICDGTEKHLVYEGKNGAYFKSDDLDSLTEVLHKLLSNSDKCEKMGKDSLKIIREKINENVVVDSYINGLNNLLNK